MCTYVQPKLGGSRPTAAVHLTHALSYRHEYLAPVSVNVVRLQCSGSINRAPGNVCQAPGANHIYTNVHMLLVYYTSGMFFFFCRLYFPPPPPLAEEVVERLWVCLCSSITDGSVTGCHTAAVMLVLLLLCVNGYGHMAALHHGTTTAAPAVCFVRSNENTYY